MLAWIVNYNKNSPEFRQLVQLPDNFTFGVDDPYEHLVMGSNEQLVPYEDHDDLLGLPPPELGKRGERQDMTGKNHSEQIEQTEQKAEDELKWLKAQVDKAIDYLLPGLPAEMSFETRVSRLVADCQRINRSWDDMR